MANSELMKAHNPSSHRTLSIIFWAIIASLISSNSTVSGSGFTELQTTLDEACIGENVMLICATSSSYLRWKVTLNDRTALPVTRSFQRTHEIGRSYYVLTNGQQLNFELINNSMGVINSTLSVHTTAALNSAVIECEGTEIKRYMFRIARTPVMPTNISVAEKTYKKRAFNVVLFWNSLTTGRVDMYHVNVSYEPTHVIQYNTTAPSVEVEGIPYDQLVIISITSVNCHSESEKAYYNLTIERCNKTIPQDGILVNDSLPDSLVIPGEEIVFSCNDPGFVPQVLMTATCLEDGRWNPDPSGISCLHVVEGNNCYECSHGDRIRIIGGSVAAAVCSAASALLFVIICIIKRNKRRRVKISEEVYIGGTEPVYDTIDPTYEVILPVTERETKLTFNGAYNL